MTTTITLNTEDYGPAGFEVEVSPDGEVLKVTSAAAQLPEMVFRITYGDRWEFAREHFQQLADNLAYRVEAAVWINDVLPEYKLLRRAFRKFSSEISPDGSEKAPLYARRAAFWIAHPETRPGLFLQKRAYSGFVAIAELLRKGRGDSEALEPWLFSLVNLLHDTEERSIVYKLIGLLGTASSSEFLFSELERPGRHPFATGLLEAVEELAVPENKERILGLHAFLAKDIDQTRNYIKVVGQLQGENVHQVLLTILHQHPVLANNVYAALQSAGYPTPGVAIRELFDQVDDLFLSDLIALIINTHPEGIRVNLQDMNAKINRPVLIDAAPVTWPQSLPFNWSTLVQASAADEFFSLITPHLLSTKPWLQRCALLQLNTWIESMKGTHSIPIPIEHRLQELLSSRYDKIYTVVLDIAAKTFSQLAQPEKMVAEILAHTLNSRYRLMNAAALKKAAENPALKKQQIVFMFNAIQNATSDDEVKELKKLIPYMRHLDLGIKLDREVHRKLTGFKG